MERDYSSGVVDVRVLEGFDVDVLQKIGLDPNDPLPASLGGLKPPPSGLSVLRSDARTSSFYRVPMLGASHSSAGGGPACLGGKDPLGTVYLVF